MPKELPRPGSGFAQSTISQDLSRGQQAEEDSQLASFQTSPSIARPSETSTLSDIFKDRYNYSIPGDDGDTISSSVQRARRGKGVTTALLFPDELRGLTGGNETDILPLPPGKHHRVLHRVSCRSESTQNIYTDVPTRIFRYGHSHLMGHHPVVDLRAITNQNSLAFIVFRDSVCEKPSQSNKRNAGQLLKQHINDEESIDIIDPGLRSEIDAIARFPSNRAAYVTPSNLPKTHISEDEFYYLFFCYHRDALATRISKASSPTKEYLQDLLSYIQEAYGTLCTRIDSLFSKGIVPRDSLKILFCPNDIILSKQGGPLAAFVIRHQPPDSSTLVFDCWSWGYDGQQLYRKSCQLSLARPSKAIVNIRDLEIYPLRYATDEEKEYLVRRGHKFWNLKSQNLATYSGWDANNDNFFSNEARCIIDYRTYRRMHPEAEVFKPSPRRDILPFDAWPETVPQNSTLAEDSVVLLPPYIHGYFLKDKAWVTLLVDQVGPVTWNKNAYECLVLPQKTKDMVKALVMVRAAKHRKSEHMRLTDKRKRDDLIGGKGNGLIMLLHGGPGTGKTLTAESVAEIAEMPLFRVTCGDIGTSAEAVEAYLRRILVLGKAWNCILLLDEADVFLEERSLSDLERNSLVSVFLRVLEYYDGILILTSNRVGTFDEAFKSRIQVALYYPELRREPRKKIWRNFLDMLEADEEDVNFDELTEYLDELADYEMNGREIRNALTTARELALFRRETLGWEHLDQSLRMVRSFNDYLKKVHGHSDDQYVRDRELR